jgi:hypothetical protein
MPLGEAVTEQEASDRLESAIRDWLAATGRDNDGKDYLTGWVLVSEHASADEMDASVATITASDGMTLIRQLGLVDYAQTVVRYEINH